MPDQDERSGHQPPQARPLRPGHDDLPRPRQVLLSHLPQHRLVTGLLILASHWSILFNTRLSLVNTFNACLTFVQ